MTPSERLEKQKKKVNFSFVPFLKYLLLIMFMVVGILFIFLRKMVVGIEIEIDCVFLPLIF